MCMSKYEYLYMLCVCARAHIYVYIYIYKKSSYKHISPHILTLLHLIYSDDFPLYF